MQRYHNYIDQFNADERQYDAAESPVDEVSLEEVVGTHNAILDSFKGNRNQCRNNQCIEDYRRQNCRCRRMQIHDVDCFQPRQRSRK